MLLRKSLAIFFVLLVAVSLWGASSFQTPHARAISAIPLENNGVAQTPFMGWSTWNYGGTNPTESNVEAQVEANKLKSYGPSLLTNTEVIALDQAGHAAHPVSQTSNQQVWFVKDNKELHPKPHALNFIEGQ